LKTVLADPQIDLNRIAKVTPGFTGADIANMVNRAAIKAAQRQAPHVDMNLLEEVRDEILMGPERKSLAKDNEQLLRTAYHEIGHTLVSLYTQGSVPLHKVTIVRRGHALGLTSFLPEKDLVSKTKKSLQADMVVSMGGRAAEELVFGSSDVDTGAVNDFQQATEIARRMTMQFGMNDKIGPVFHDLGSPSKTRPTNNDMWSEEEKKLIDEEIKKTLMGSYEQAKQILREHEPELHKLAKVLKEHETLSAEDVKRTLAEGSNVSKKGMNSGGKLTKI